MTHTRHEHKTGGLRLLARIFGVRRQALRWGPCPRNGAIAGVNPGQGAVSLG
jgi:hypothetical protein